MISEDRSEKTIFRFTVNYRMACPWSRNRTVTKALSRGEEAPTAWPKDVYRGGSPVFGFFRSKKTIKTWRLFVWMPQESIPRKG